jgi:hypothetical protein
VNRVRASRTVNGIDGTKIEDHIKIANEGEPIRALGAWVGNKVDQISTWTKTIDNIDDALDRWDKGHPTMEGRRLIIMMVVGGMTQYLAKVQGMLPDIEKKLERRIQAFLWNDKSLIAVNQETVSAPIDMGGRNLMDIIACNEAISATWLKSYLDLGPARPLWGFAADE